jgi:hypothetical protein
MKNPAGNQRFGHIAGDEYILRILFAIQLQFKPADNARQ